MLRNGHGPDSAFRAYLLTVVRNGFYQRLRNDRRLEFTDDMDRHDQVVAWSDPVEAERLVAGGRGRSRRCRRGGGPCCGSRR